MLYIYLLILLFVIVLIIKNMFKAESIFDQIDASLVLVPLILRLLLIK